MFPAGVTRESEAAGETAIWWIGPNPAGESATVKFTLATSGPMTLAVYDTRGDLVARLASGLQESGTYSQVWNLTDANRARVAGGAYLIRLETKQGSTSRRIVVAR